jgi:hypothetical protein
MNTKILIVLAAVTVVAGAVAVGVSVRSPDSTDIASGGEKLFPALASRANDARTLTVARKDSTVTLTKGEQDWMLSDKANYPADFAKVRKLIVELAELRTLEAKTKTPGLYASLEVEDLATADAKSTQVTLKDAGGAVLADILVGKQRYGRGGSVGDGVYVRKVGDAQAWQARGRITLERDAVSWLDKTIADVSRERVRQVTVTQPDGAKLIVRRDKPDDKDFTIVDKPADRKVKSEYDVNAVAGALERLELDDVRLAKDMEFADGAPAVELITFDGLNMRIHLVTKDDQSWARLSATFEAPAEPIKPEGAAAKLKSADDVLKEAEQLNARTANWAYRLPTFKAEAMRRKLADLLEEKAS